MSVPVGKLKMVQLAGTDEWLWPEGVFVASLIAIGGGAGGSSPGTYNIPIAGGVSGAMIYGRPIYRPANGRSAYSVGAGGAGAGVNATGSVVGGAAGGTSTFTDALQTHCAPGGGVSGSIPPGNVSPVVDYYGPMSGGSYNTLPFSFGAASQAYGSYQASYGPGGLGAATLFGVAGYSGTGNSSGQGFPPGATPSTSYGAGGSGSGSGVAGSAAAAAGAAGTIIIIYADPNA
ncbi:MAG: hypothetical protein JNM52_08050 [Betaproteobacteria bacterium]|nr:hypothetical protein [Betaproteobacteria bacterium]